MTTAAVIDTHAHLDELDNMVEEVKEAQKSNIRAIIAIGQDLVSNQKAMEAAQKYSGFVFPAIGYHPWRLDPDADGQILEQIDTHLRHCVALGEIGLDYKAKTKKNRQRQIFSELLALAKAYEKPVILHCRYSHETAFQIVQDLGIKQVVFHWYSGPLELISRIAAQGYYMSASPALLSNPYHREAIQAVPISNLLLETDCPVRYGDLTARPIHVLTVLSEVAKTKNLDIEQIAKTTTANAIACFGLNST